MSKDGREELRSILREMTRETHELLHVPEYIGSIDPMVCLREHVGASKPFVVRQDVDVARWAARSAWCDSDYLVKKLEGRRVTVALTPDGLADAVVDGYFALPLYRKMYYQEFLRMLSAQRGSHAKIEGGFGHHHASSVVYLQKQNDSLRSEFAPLLEDIGNISWADTSFGSSKLDAINFWEGSFPTKTSWHRDPYENVYVVLKGQKKVRLLPPTDAHRMKIRQYRQAKWSLNGESMEFKLEEQDGMEDVRWSSLAPCACSEDVDVGASYGEIKTRGNSMCDSCSHLREHPPKEVILNPGDCLYIPAFYYHELSHPRVRVSHPANALSAVEDKNGYESTISVNFWYDTSFGVGYPTMLAVDELARLARLNE
jgi:jumonji domain-containing protein 7